MQAEPYFPIPQKKSIFKASKLKVMTGSVLQVAYEFPFFLDEELDEIFRARQKVHFKRGETILREGETANEYFILEKGLARLFVNDFNGK